jgi:hypothetical protein
MADLSAAETTPGSCCAPEQRARCCEPGEKGDCCAPESSTCSCSAGQSGDDDDVRERVRDRETHRVDAHAGAAIIRAQKPGSP